MAWRWLYRLADGARHRLRLRRIHSVLAWGRRGEDLAQRLLQSKGYRVVARNYRTLSGSGELDLVAWDAGVLVFVEVKSRHSAEYGAPDRAIDAEKRRRIIRAASDYMQRIGRARRPDPPFRFDVVTVVWSTPPTAEHMVDAFFPVRR